MAPAPTQELDEEPGEEHDDEFEPEGRCAPEPLAPEVRARREAALRHVRSFGDPALRSRGLAVERFDEPLTPVLRAAGFVPTPRGLVRYA